MTARTATLRYALLLAPLLAATPARAVPEDAMEVQRCIWRCMEATPGWGGRNARAYNQCTIDRCSSRKAGTRKRRRR